MSLYLFTRYVDMINLMTYDFHGGSFDSKTGPNSPLKGHPQETGSDAYFNVVRIFRQYNKKSKTFIAILSSGCRWLLSLVSPCSKIIKKMQKFSGI